MVFITKIYYNTCNYNITRYHVKLINYFISLRVFIVGAINIIFPLIKFDIINNKSGIYLNPFRYFIKYI